MFVLVVCHGSVKYVRLEWCLQNYHQPQLKVGELKVWTFANHPGKKNRNYIYNAK